QGPSRQPPGAADLPPAGVHPVGEEHREQRQLGEGVDDVVLGLQHEDVEDAVAQEEAPGQEQGGRRQDGSVDEGRHQHREQQQCGEDQQEVGHPGSFTLCRTYTPNRPSRQISPTTLTVPVPSRKPGARPWNGTGTALERHRHGGLGAAAVPVVRVSWSQDQGVEQASPGSETSPFGAPAVNPNEADAPGARFAFQPAGLTVTTLPFLVGVPFHRAWISWPEFMVRTAVQELTPVLPAVMVTWPLKPLFHWAVRV